MPGLPNPLSARFQAYLGGPEGRRIAQWALLLPRFDALAPQLEALSDYDLRKRSLALRYRAKSGEPLERLLVEGYALVREAGRRTIRLRHYDVQMLGGTAMFHRSIAEMQTGEGKTLTATLPLYLHALSGKGAHLATVNDYLARRDADWMRPIYEALGVTVGVIESNMDPAARRKAYACDITYGTAKEFGFDFLRDRLLLREIREGMTDLFGRMLGQSRDGSHDQPTQREPYFALVDEADSILIDEASTPLIIGAPPSEEELIENECHKWSARVADQFVEDEDYTYDHETRKVELTAAGRQRVRGLPKDDVLDTVGMFTMYEFIERGIKVAREFFRDRHFVIRDDEVVIVDEFTGRLAEGRKWRDGIHQAVEAKEGVKITGDGGQAARVTVQDFFLRYRHLAGMTGTAASSRGELSRIYRVHVVDVPTNRPAIRRRLKDRTYGTADQKWAAIVDEVREVHATGRPVLIGTRSIDKSEQLSALLHAAGIKHDVLNANQIEHEAKIVAEAGQRGRVTVSTNMAGRGTDIRLGDDIRELGGLHVICTEMHDAARIDRQLIGRCGRQGDPGTYRQYLALDDDILRSGFGPKRAERLASLGESNNDSFDGYSRLFRKAQRRIERRNFRSRKVLLYYEKERKKSHLQMGMDPYLDQTG